jgi:multiple sugar transport system substrate-binding protein
LDNSPRLSSTACDPKKKWGNELRTVIRRDALKALGAAALAASGTMSLGLTIPAAAGLRNVPETGATLRVLRWKRFVQGDEDQWLANTRKFADQTGVAVQVESVNGEDLRPKGAMAANVGAGPDILIGPSDMPQLYPEHCIDLTDTANDLGRKYGGWYDACRNYSMLEGRWISLPVAVIAYCIVYRESMVKDAGYAGTPRDLAGFLKLCQALKARGKPAGFALGNSAGDTTWCSWLLWAHGAKLVDEHNRVAINSRETIAALEYARELYGTFIQGTLSWLDPSNNKAFLAGEISLTYNPISIYYAARNSSDPAMQAIAADIRHAHMPIGPVGHPTELNAMLTAFVFRYTRFPNAAREYLRFMLEREQYEAWQQASLGYMSQTLRTYESNPVWTSDPRITLFRDGARLMLYNGYAGKVGAASAACSADLVIANMVAEAASGQASPREAAARAEQRGRRHYKT